MSTAFKVACVQPNSGREIAPNVETVSAMVRQARAAGADLITTPENVSMMEIRSRLSLEKARPQDEHPALAAFQDLARETGAWLLVGSLAIRLPDDMIANRSVLLDDAGTIVATYDKIHMFDVDLGDGQEYRESKTIRSGDRAVIAETPWGKLGMSVCYDLRFPHLYRALAKAGADFLAVPAAFTRTTGRAHWHVLMQARAIENGCYVFAPAQCGDHEDGRETFGHSLIVDPWGEILADGGEDVGVIMAEVDVAGIAEARRKIPALTHDRPYAAPEG